MANAADWVRWALNGFARPARSLRRLRGGPDPILAPICQALRENDLDALKEAFPRAEHGSHIFSRRRGTWFERAIKDDVGVPLLEYLVKAGVDPSARSSESGDMSPMMRAVYEGRPDYVRFLLDHGVDPNAEPRDRLLLEAVAVRHPTELQIKLCGALIDGGCDVNRRFDVFGDTSKTFTVLDHAEAPAVKEYLRGRGAEASARQITEADRHEALGRAMRDEK